MTTYTVNQSSVNWSDPQAIAYARPHPDCGHKHRTPEAAARCDETRVQRPVRRANPGSRVWIDTRILATEADGAERRMTEDEAYDAIIAADNA